MVLDTRFISKSDDPLVSVIVAAYNCQEFLCQTIESIRAQTFSEFELIIVDDGSTDNTLEIAQRFSNSDERITVIHQLNSGTAACARNTGLALARGEYVCFLDGDDLYKRTKLACQVEFMNQFPDLGVTFHDVQLIDATGDWLNGTYLGNYDYIKKVATALQPIGKDLYLATDTFYPFMTYAITGMHTSAVMIRRTELLKEDEMFIPTAPIGEDIDLWFRLAFRCQVGFINSALSYYRQHPSSVTRDNEKLIKGWIFAHTRNLTRALNKLTPSQINDCNRKIATQYSNLAFEQRSRKKFVAALVSYIRSLSHSFDLHVFVAMLKTLIHPNIRQ